MAWFAATNRSSDFEGVAVLVVSGGAGDVFVDGEIGVVVGEGEAALEGECFAVEFPLGDFDVGVAVPVVRAGALNAFLRIGWVDADAARSATDSEAEPSFAGSRSRFSCWFSALEGFRRDGFVDANLLDGEGVTNPGDFVFGGTAVADLVLAAHDHVGGRVDPEKRALRHHLGSGRRFVGDGYDVAAVFLAENFGGGDVLINVLEQECVGLRQIRAEGAREMGDFGEGRGGVLWNAGEVRAASVDGVEMLAVRDLFRAVFAKGFEA